MGLSHKHAKASSVSGPASRPVAPGPSVASANSFQPQPAGGDQGHDTPMLAAVAGKLGASPPADPKKMNTMSWAELGGLQRHWEVLGWNQKSWDGNRPPASAGKPFGQLNPEEQKAAKALNFDASTWDSDDEIGRALRFHRERLGSFSALDGDFGSKAAAVVDLLTRNHGDSAKLTLGFMLKGIPSVAGATIDLAAELTLDVERFSPEEVRLTLAGGLEANFGWNTWLGRVGLVGKLGASIAVGGENGAKVLTLLLAALHRMVSAVDSKKADALFGRGAQDAFRPLDPTEREGDVAGKLDSNDWVTSQGEGSAGVKAEGNTGKNSLSYTQKRSLGVAYGRKEDGTLRTQRATSTHHTVDVNALGHNVKGELAHLYREGQPFLNIFKVATEVELDQKQLIALQQQSGGALLLADINKRAIAAGFPNSALTAVLSQAQVKLGGQGTLLTAYAQLAKKNTFKLEVRYDHWASGRLKADVRLKRAFSLKGTPGSAGTDSNGKVRRRGLGAKVQLDLDPSLLSIIADLPAPTEVNEISTRPLRLE